MTTENTKNALMKMTRFRWVLVALLFLATTINYMDRQVLSLTWKDFIRPEFDWTDSDYGTITGLFSIFYAIANLFAGKFVDWVGNKERLPHCHRCMVVRCRAPFLQWHPYLWRPHGSLVRRIRRGQATSRSLCCKRTTDRCLSLGRQGGLK